MHEALARDDRVEARAKGGQNSGDHHRRIRRVLAAVLLGCPDTSRMPGL